MAFALLFARVSHANNPETPENAPPPDTRTTFLDHTRQSAFWFGGEVNSIFQGKPGFAAAYSGPNSLSKDGEVAVSGIVTLFTAYRPFRTTELILDAELAFGGGLSSALGVAGFTNLDVVRNPTLGSEPYIARLQWHQLIPLSRHWIRNEDRGPISSFAWVPEHRLEFRIGKLSTADLFDVNPAGSDSHMQFMNWTVDNNGAYDYAADTRGYTYGLLIEYQGPRIEARFGEMLMPMVANGLDIDFDLLHNHAENFELEIKYSRVPGFFGTLRVLTFINHANMGSYSEAIAGFLNKKTIDGSVDTVPTIEHYRHAGNVKYGFGLNLIQNLGEYARIFARGGLNDGQNESFAYTEVDDTFEFGGDMSLGFWRRQNDRFGLAFVTNGLSQLHRDYLRLGGRGFLLGDGGLNYGREYIVETYYNAQVWRGAFLAPDIQFVQNPGYNQDRGPVLVFSIRAHLEF